MSKAGLTYVADFYNNVVQLTDHYSKYLITLVDFDELEQKVNDEGIEEAVVKQIQAHNQQLRYFLSQAIIQAEIIQENFKEINKEELKKFLKEGDSLVNKKIMPRQEVKEVVKQLQKILSTEILQDLLQTNQSLVEDIYNQ